MLLQVIRDFINYWYFRYLLVTELYMVEKWERAMFHIVVFFLLSIFYLLNTTLMMGLVRIGTNYVFTQEIPIQEEYTQQISNGYQEL